MTTGTLFFKNETQGRALVFRPDLCSGCGECIEACPQGLLRPMMTAKKAVAWKVRVYPEPEDRICTECGSCLPKRLGGSQEPGAPPVLCPWGACTMCGECARVCPDRAIYTVPLPAEEAPEPAERGGPLPAPASPQVNYGQLGLEPPDAPLF